MTSNNTVPPKIPRAIEMPSEASRRQAKAVIVFLGATIAVGLLAALIAYALRQQVLASYRPQKVSFANLVFDHKCAFTSDAPSIGRAPVPGTGSGSSRT